MVSDIIALLEKPMPQFAKSKHVPIGRIEDYLFGLERAGAAPEQLARVKQENMIKAVTYAQKAKVPKPLFIEELPESIQRLHREYYSKCIRPPMKEMVKAYEEAGYPPEKIAKMKKFYITETRNEEKNQMIIDKMFAKYKCKTGRTAPKKVLKVVKKRI